MIEFLTLHKYSSGFKPLRCCPLRSGGRTHVHGVEELLRRTSTIYNGLLICL
jgi:hypothetical protein